LFDSKKVLECKDVRFRLENKRLIDAFYFSTFHGGKQPDWAPEIDSYIFYDDFAIDTEPDYLIKHGNINKDHFSYYVYFKMVFTFTFYSK